MEKRTANKLKILIAAAMVLNLLVVLAQMYNTAATVKSAKNSLALTGFAALSTFEGGRRAMMALDPDYSPRFKEILKDTTDSSTIRSLYLFDEKGEMLLNSGDVDLPKVELSKRLVVQTAEGLLVIKRINQHHMGMGRMGRMHNYDGFNTPQTVAYGGALLDSSGLESIKASQYGFLTGVVLLQILLAAVFYYTIRFMRHSTEQSRQLELAEREAQMGKMSLVMAHELKNPLSSVKGLIEFSAKKSEGAAKDIAERCVDELSRLDRIVNDFLTYGRDISIEKTEVSLLELTKKTAELLTADAAAKSITINVSGTETRIKADSPKMMQVLFNLLLNAVQASPENTSVSVVISPHSLTVTNRIAGTVPETEKIGTPFYTTKTVGTGLGIAIVKRILTLHGFGLNLSAKDVFTAEITF
ncbi:ATP-binding protein [Seleniivibrio woodruffii]|uniref:histidine kinase n=1 Tax=Seleniivibrio woodruffii TaxID=1078050 RepID=A0A4R1KFD8_9BACT|nr:ATP-binding protein [Seleniivibrio woodruffii]TCK62019.1 two-component system sensor histidine kinase HydH [Seleniivibrio woodruffii]TVZ34864.1 two-component system sensor histidine kinase HydH [Seleniivibrio woodruffii]